MKQLALETNEGRPNIVCRPQRPGCQQLLLDLCRQLRAHRKPAIEHGLLVPLQVRQNHTLRVTLTAATSEANTPMAEPPRFYLYRSLVWPAPGSITAHGGLNVRPQRSDSNGWVLQADVTPGLYLLVFERDRWEMLTDTDPSHFPATVSYRLEAAP